MKVPFEERELSLTAVLFVGGLSTRMGRDKAMVEFGGEPLWRRQLSVLRQFGPAGLQISARVAPAWCPSDVELILDEPPSQGPLTGLAAVLNRVRTSHLLALAVDLPRMSIEELGRLWRHARPGGGVIPVNGKHLEPLCAVYPAEAAAPAVAALKAGELSLQKLATALIREGRLLEYHLTEEEKPLFQNVNSPEDLRSR